MAPQKPASKAIVAPEKPASKAPVAPQKPASKAIVAPEKPASKSIGAKKDTLPAKQNPPVPRRLTRSNAPPKGSELAAPLTTDVKGKTKRVKKQKPNETPIQQIDPSTMTNEQFNLFLASGAFGPQIDTRDYVPGEPPTILMLPI